jgi:hypothetical protein
MPEVLIKRDTQCYGIIYLEGNYFERERDEKLRNSPPGKPHRERGIQMGTIRKNSRPRPITLFAVVRMLEGLCT